MKPIFPIIAMAIACTSCGQDEPQLPETTPIDISVGVESTVSRAPVYGSHFGENERYGLFICKSGSFTEHYRGFNNMRVIFSSGRWIYYYESGDFWFKKLFIFKNDTPADFYAYAPWMKGVRTPEDIPFTIGGNSSDQPDMMYAVQNIDPARNKGIVPDGETKTVYLNFRHVLSCLRFRFRLRDKIMPITINSVSISAVEGGPKLYKGATMNALADSPETALSKYEETDRLTISRYNLTLKEDNLYEDADLLIIPVDVNDVAEDGTVYTVSFYTEHTPYPYIFKIPRSGLRHADGTMGFRPGYVYTFDFTIDNYLHLDGIYIDNEWKTGNDVNIVI